MIVKQIRCHLQEDSMERFAVGQEQWKSIRSRDGFLWQFGGFDVVKKDTALILSCWETVEDYNAFMNEDHDRIYEYSGQKDCCKSIVTSLFEKPIEFKPETPLDSRKFQFCKLTDSFVYDEQVQHFEKAQTEIWAPGFKDVLSLHQGFFLKHNDVEQRFLNIYLWVDEMSQQEFLHEEYAELYSKANPVMDLQAFENFQFIVEPAWWVEKSRKL